MDSLIKLDWAAIFVPKMSLLEIVVRATVTYLGLCLILRIIPKRQVGRSSTSDILFVVLVGGITVEALIRQADSLTDCFLMLTTVLLWTYVIDVLSFRYRWFRHLILEPPTCLIRNGRILKENLRQEMVSVDDLLRELRRQNVPNLAGVREAHLEADGEISVLQKGEAGEGANISGGLKEHNANESEEESPCQQSPCNGELHNEKQCYLNRQAAPSARVDASEEEEAEAELREFLAAAEKVQARLARHQEQIARLKEGLARFGVRARMNGKGQKEKPADASHSN